MTYEIVLQRDEAESSLSRMHVLQILRNAMQPFLWQENNVLPSPLTSIVCLWGPTLIYEFS